MTAGTVILLAKQLKKGGKQLKWPRVTRDIATALCVLGWLAVSYLTGVKGKKSVCLQAILGSLLIVATVMTLEEQKVTFSDEPVSYIVPLLYVLGWFLLGRGTAMESGRLGKRLGLVASVMAVVSGLYLMPCQRKKRVVDGPGVMMCTLVWVFLSVAYSTKN